MATVQRKLVHKQFNSPIGLYSDANVKETLNRELKVITNGTMGIDVDDSKLTHLANSAVLRALEEEERQKRVGPGLKRVAWPPPSESPARYVRSSPAPNQSGRLASPYPANNNQNYYNSSQYQAPSKPQYQQGQFYAQQRQQEQQYPNQQQTSNYPYSQPSQPNYQKTVPSQPIYKQQQQQQQQAPTSPYQQSAPIDQFNQSHYQPSPVGQQSIAPPRQEQTPVRHQSIPVVSRTPQSSTAAFTGGIPVSGKTGPNYVIPPKHSPYGSTASAPFSPVTPSYNPLSPPIVQQHNAPAGWSHVDKPQPVRSGYTFNNQPSYGAPAQVNYQQQSPSGGQLNNTAPQFGYQPTGQYQEPQPNYNQSDYSQPQYQDTGYPNQRQTTPGFMTLRQSTPISQKPNPVYTAQPAATTLKGGVNMRGDQKWPPVEYKAAAAENEARRKLALGPVCRPRRVQKDYTQFFAQHAINNTYPGYKAPPERIHRINSSDSACYY